MPIKRYEWEDALITAQRDGIISNAVLLTALKLAHVVNWAPKKGKRVGINWKNDSAFEACGLGRATAYRNRDALFAAGFMVLQGNNWEPRLPESQGETAESQVETLESQGDNPFSVDTLSEDVLSEEKKEPVPGGPVLLTVREEDEVMETMEHSLNYEDTATASKHEVVEPRQSQVETDWLGEDKEWFERYGQRVPANWLNKNRDQRERFKQEYEWGLEWSKEETTNAQL